MRRLLFLALFVLMTVAVQAQPATVRGFVTDASTEVTMQGASVTLLQDGELMFGVATDGDGYFLLNRIPPGAYTLRVSFVGFEAYEEALTITAGAIIERSIALAPSSTEIDEIVVEAEVAGGVTTVIAGLESVVPADISRVPVPGVSGDLAGFLQTLPGVVVQGDRGGQFFVRGGAVDQNLALLDGLPVYMPFHVLSFYSAFPEDVVNRADFFTGGYGARHGSRVSSIIDVQARNGNKQNLAGTVGLAPFLSEVRIEGPIVPQRASLIVNVRQSLIEQLFPNLLGQAMPYRFGDRFGKLHALVGNAHSISFMVLDTEDVGDIAGTKKSFDGETLPSTSSDSTTVAWDNRVFGGTYEFRPRTLPIVARFTAGRSTMSNAFGPSSDAKRKSGIESTDLRADITWLLNAGTIDAGISQRRSTLDFELDGIFEDYTSASEDLTEVQGYLQTDVWVGGDRFNFNPGVHLYALTERDDAWFEPRVRMSWYPEGRSGKLNLHAAWGQYHQAIVGLNDERDLGSQFTAWTVAQEGRDAPMSTHTILGASYSVARWLDVAVEGYHKTYSELSVPIFSTFPQFTTALQSADGTAYGIDARIDMTNRPFWWNSTLNGYLTYAYSQVEYDAGGITYNPAHDRRQQLNILLNMDLTEVSITVQFQAGTGLPYTQSTGFDKWYLLTPDVDVSSEPGRDRILYGEPYKGRQPDYARMDLWLERRIERGRYVATLKAGVVNVFNRDNLFYYDLFEFLRVDQLPLIPSIGAKLELR